MNEINYCEQTYQYKINDVLISNQIFDKELFDFSIVEKNEFIERLIDWISETRNDNDKQLMKDDLKYLINLSDKYIFSSISTNEYIAESDNKELFNELCNELIKLNNKKDIDEANFLINLDNEGFNIEDINEFIQEHYENLESFEYNKKKFKKMFGDEKNE